MEIIINIFFPARSIHINIFQHKTRMYTGIAPLTVGVSFFIITQIMLKIADIGNKNIEL